MISATSRTAGFAIQSFPRYVFARALYHRGAEYSRYDADNGRQLSSFHNGTCSEHLLAYVYSAGTSAQQFYDGIIST